VAPLHLHPVDPNPNSFVGSVFAGQVRILMSENEDTQRSDTVHPWNPSRLSGNSSSDSYHQFLSVHEMGCIDAINYSETNCLR